MNLETSMGLIISAFGIGVFLWRVIIYFWNKNKCFNDTMSTNKQLKTDMITMQSQMQKLEESFDELKDEIKDDFHQERTEGSLTHKELYERINNIDKNLAFALGKGSINGEKKPQSSKTFQDK